MPITESRIKAGSLTFDLGVPPPAEFATQATNIKLTPSVDDGEDPLEVLSGDTLEDPGTTSWVMAIAAIQDFEDVAGFVRFALENDGELVTYSWKPQGAAGPTFTGSCTVRAVEIGGDVNARLLTEAEWPCTGKPVVTDPA